MSPVYKHEGKTVVRTNCSNPTPFLRALEPNLRTLMSILYRKPRALDIGCGFGRNSEYVRTMGYEVQSLDQHPDYHRGIKWDLSNQIPVFSKSVELVLLQYVLMFLPGDDRDRLVRQALNVCGVPGMIVVEMYPAKDSFMDKSDIAQFLKEFTQLAYDNGFRVAKKDSSRIAVINFD